LPVRPTIVVPLQAPFVLYTPVLVPLLATAGANSDM